VTFESEALRSGCPSETAGEPLVDWSLDIGNGAAGAAYEMIVWRLCGFEEAEPASGIDGANSPLGDEDAEISIDGAETEFGLPVPDEAIDLVGGEVTATLFYGLEDRLSLSAASMDHEQSHANATQLAMSIINNRNCYCLDRQKKSGDTSPLSDPGREPGCLIFGRRRTLSREGASAATAAGRVGVGEGETGAHYIAHIIDLDLIQVLRAEHVHEDTQAVRFNHFIRGRRRLLDVHRVLESGTTSRHNANTKTGIVAHVLGRNKLPDLNRCGVR
jgi:hypothetical protein